MNKFVIPSQLLDTVPNKVDHVKADECYRGESARYIRKLFVQYLNKKLSESVTKSDDPTNLTHPSYAATSAYWSGYRKAIKDLTDLLDR